MSYYSYQHNKQPLPPVTNTKKLVHLVSILISLLILGLLSGCADHSAKNRELLSKDYQTLSDDDLTRYYYELGDQINVVEQERNNSSISLGLGMGSYSSGRGTSGGVGLTTGGGQASVATNLRDRRNEVKLEMQKRNLKP